LLINVKLPRQNPRITLTGIWYLFTKDFSALKISSAMDLLLKRLVGKLEPRTMVNVALFSDRRGDKKKCKRVVIRSKTPTI